MPVVECTCGMVMSVASGGRRTSCIRCGIQLHVLDQANQENQAERRHQSPASSVPSSSGGLPLLLSEIPLMAAEAMHE
jgi:hypothetical protein